jgi:hypothetical protein
MDRRDDAFQADLENRAASGRRDVAIYAAGSGEVRFSDFRYRALR